MLNAFELFCDDMDGWVNLNLSASTEGLVGTALTGLLLACWSWGHPWAMLVGIGGNLLHKIRNYNFNLVLKWWKSCSTLCFDENTQNWSNKTAYHSSSHQSFSEAEAALIIAYHEHLWRCEMKRVIKQFIIIFDVEMMIFMYVSLSYDKKQRKPDLLDLFNSVYLQHQMLSLQQHFRLLLQVIEELFLQLTCYLQQFFHHRPLPLQLLLQ